MGIYIFDNHVYVCTVNPGNCMVILKKGCYASLDNTRADHIVQTFDITQNIMVIVRKSLEPHRSYINQYYIRQESCKQRTTSHNHIFQT